MQCGDEIVGGIDLFQIGQLLDSLQVLKFVVLDIQVLQHGELSQFNWQLREAHPAEVQRPFVASFGMSDLEFNVAKHF